MHYQDRFLQPQNKAWKILLLFLHSETKSIICSKQCQDTQAIFLLQEGVDFWRLYALYNIKDWKLSTIDKVEALKQVPKLLALFFVVAFGSSLDVAAIQAGVDDPLDFNHELKTVGE